MSSLSLWTFWTMARVLGRPFITLPNKIRQILAARGLTLAEISRASRPLASGNLLRHIPHNFYSSLRDQRFSPSLYQVLSLSVLTGYRLADWLAVFGFSLDDVPRFQASFPTFRTVELDARVYRSSASIAWFKDLKEPDLSGPLVPLSRWLASNASRRFDIPSHPASLAYRYFKIGSHDAFSFPDLLPGSIVRVNSEGHAPGQLPVGKTPAKRLFLVEHSRGLICSRVCRPEASKIVLCPGHLPYAPVELKQGGEVAVLGTVDFEIRPMQTLDKPVVPTQLGRYWTPAPLERRRRGEHVGEFICRARERSGLSFREASERTRLLASSLGDSRYYCAAGSLSDYETRKLPPRHIHKLISICAVYFASAADLLDVSGAHLDKAGTLLMPPEFWDLSVGEDSSVSQGSRLLIEMEQRFGQLPYFLHHSLSALFRMPEISVRDVFWAGGMPRAVHPYLARAVFLVVDRKWKMPRPALSFPKWAQPIYVLQQRDGGYLCGFCILQSGTLILRPCFEGMPKLLRLRNEVDAEVVGKVVGVARQLE